MAPEKARTDTDSVGSADLDVHVSTNKDISSYEVGYRYPQPHRLLSPPFGACCTSKVTAAQLIGIFCLQALDADIGKPQGGQSGL